MSKIKINKNDKNRVLLTELLPYEVPMLFSNEGFYKIVSLKVHEEHIAKIKSVRNIGTYGIPFDYKISKGKISESRTLSIIHPMNQLKFIDFYEKYDSIIQYNCKLSPFSLRQIKGIAQYNYIPDLVFTEEDTLKSAESEIETDSEYQSHVFKSYFTYHPIDLIYKFYDRFDYRRLEQKFNFLMIFDINKCFYNIYTHSITWAIKGKEIAKSNARALTFENSFDKIMQLANYNETNGILVGPEISRLFAEIILSKIDRNVKEELLNQGLIQSKDYDIRRYVDDYFVYANENKIINKIKKILQDELEKYKLYHNEKKLEIKPTPFINKLSVGKHEVKLLVKDFFSRAILEEESEDLEEQRKKLKYKIQLTSPYSF